MNDSFQRSDGSQNLVDRLARECVPLTGFGEVITVPAELGYPAMDNLGWGIRVKSLLPAVVESHVLQLLRHLTLLQFNDATVTDALEGTGFSESGSASDFELIIKKGELTYPLFLGQS